jgi:hypothetical protein
MVPSGPFFAKHPFNLIENDISAADAYEKLGKQFLSLMEKYGGFRSKYNDLCEKYKLYKKKESEEYMEKAELQEIIDRQRCEIKQLKQENQIFEQRKKIEKLERELEQRGQNIELFGQKAEEKLDKEDE